MKIAYAIIIVAMETSELISADTDHFYWIISRQSTVSYVETYLESVTKSLTHRYHLLSVRKDRGADILIYWIAIPHIFYTAINVIFLESGNKLLIEFIRNIKILLLIFVGYVAGIASKFTNEAYMAAFAQKWYVLVFYFINIAMVSADILLYFRNRALDNKAENGEG